MNIVFLLYHPSSFSNWINKLSPFFYGANIYVLHISKLHGVQPDVIDAYTAIDISYCSYKKLENILRNINPDVFVFLSFRSLLEYTINRLCVNLGIRKIYLEHGLFSVDTLNFRKNKSKKEIIKTIRRQAIYWLVQLGLVMHSKHPLLEIKLAICVYRNNEFEKASYDHYYVFSKRSFDCYKPIFNLNEKDVTYIGYPIFNNDADKLDTDMQGDEKGILYVHQPLISDGIASISYEEEKRYLKMLADMLKDRYGDFTILLHPRADLYEYRERFNDVGIKIVQSPNNYKLFANKSLIIGHYSTALLYGLYFNKPTVVLDYPSTETASMFKDLFVYCNDVKKLSTMRIPVDTLRKDYVVGKHNTFKYIAEILLNDINDEVNFDS